MLVSQYFLSNWLWSKRGLLVSGSVWSSRCDKVQVRCRDVWRSLQSRYNSTYRWQARSFRQVSSQCILLTVTTSFTDCLALILTIL